MDRTATFVTAGLSAVVTLTATAAIAVNTGLLALPDDDVAGTLEATPAAVAETEPAPIDVETVYVDVQDEPGAPVQRPVVVVPAPTTTAPAGADGEVNDGDAAVGAAEVEDHDADEDDDAYEDEDDEDGDDEDGEDEEEDEEEHEYEGWDEDD